MFLSKRPNGYYYVFYEKANGKLHCISTKAKNKNDALKLLSEFQSRARTSTSGDSSSIDLKTFSFVYLKYSENYHRPKTYNMAPLTVKSEGRINKDVSFAGTVFPANEDLSGSYKFNSYRLTYRYDFVQNPNLEFGLGLTAKIRDARIALSSPEISAEKSNVGFVPIINFRLFWHSYERFGFLIEGDALAAKQGRAIDVLAAASFNLNDQSIIRAGYRILEGRADNDEVYNFALFYYLSLSFSYIF